LDMAMVVKHGRRDRGTNMATEVIKSPLVGRQNVKSFHLHIIVLIHIRRSALAKPDHVGKHIEKAGQRCGLDNIM
jgi:hypothetical protein